MNFVQLLKQLHVVGQDLFFLDQLSHWLPERLNPTNSDLLNCAV